MRTVEKFTVTTDGAGAADVTLRLPPCVIEAIAVVRGTLANGAADLTFTDSLTGEAILTITNIAVAQDLYRPRTLVQTSAGADHASQVERPAVFAGVRLVVAQGGAAASGTVYLMIDR